MWTFKKMMVQQLYQIELILQKQGVRIMQLSQDVLNLLSALDTATTAIGTDLKSVADKLTALRAQVDAIDGSEVKAQLQAAVDKLQAVAAAADALAVDPANPVPAPVVTP